MSFWLRGLPVVVGSARNKMAAGKTGELGESTGQKNLSRPSNLCCYSQRVCNLEKLKGFDFCHKHILEDKASPFKPCDFYAKSNERRCMNPAPKLPDKEKSYCIIHTRKAELRRAVEKRRKKRARDSITVEEDEEESSSEKRKRTSSTASQKSIDGSQKDEECHSSDDDLSLELGIGGSLKVDSAWHGDVDSDAESVDSEEEDALRHAGVWTLDEASKICYEKMIRLKSLYAAQYKRLFHVLKEKRRKYLQVIQAEQENESIESHLSPSEILRSPAHHKRHGVEALLHKQAKEKRHGGSSRYQNTSHQRCTHAADGVRCPNRILPLTKYCIHHISHDPNQLLFQSCSFKTGDQKTCNNMVPKIYPFSTCQLHITLPVEANTTDIKKELEEAKKRDKEKKVSEEEKREEAISSVAVNTIPPLHQVTDKQLPIPKALQEKSSALIPPLAQETKAVSTSQETLPTIKVSAVASEPTKPSPLKVERMAIDSLSLEGSSAKSRGSSDSTPMEVLSPASADSPAGVQNISPSLLAASLAAVCSDAPSTATVTSPLAMTSSSSSDPAICSDAPSAATVTSPLAMTSSSSSDLAVCSDAPSTATVTSPLAMTSSSSSDPAVCSDAPSTATVTSPLAMTSSSSSSSNDPAVSIPSSDSQTTPASTVSAPTSTASSTTTSSTSSTSNDPLTLSLSTQSALTSVTPAKSETPKDSLNSSSSSSIPKSSDLQTASSNSGDSGDSKSKDDALSKKTLIASDLSNIKESKEITTTLPNTGTSSTMSTIATTVSNTSEATGDTSINTSESEVNSSKADSLVNTDIVNTDLVMETNAMEEEAAAAAAAKSSVANTLEGSVFKADQKTTKLAPATASVLTLSVPTNESLSESILQDTQSVAISESDKQSSDNQSMIEESQ